MSLPSGMVTFLFTDLEDSTTGWDVSRDGMLDALAKHYELADRATKHNRGCVVKRTGDGCMAVFADPARAVAAAVEIQVSSEESGWHAPVGPLRTRIGIHTGPGEPKDEDYLGPSVNRAARLEEAGHGGQILVSAATRELVGDRMEEVSFRDLGEHRLRGLTRPERVYQVLSQGLSAGFPPLRTETAPTNLPAHSEDFIGRSDELRALVAAMEKSRLVTVTGAGGVGKTTLAMEAARSLTDRYKGGVWVLELAPLSDGQLVTTGLLGAMRRPAPTDREPEQVLVDVLASQHALIVLDDCEHLLADVASLATRIMRNTPRVSLLATSREPLRVRGEQVWPIPTMSLPKTADLAGVLASDAGALFIARAKQADHRIAFDDTTAAMVAEICRSLDGLPLAIELAAARLRSMGIDELNTRLQNRFRLLRTRDRDVIPHHQTLHDTVAWSYDQLEPDVQRLYRRLSIFAGGFDLDAAETVGGDELDVWDGLENLVGRSLIEIDRGTTTRYRMLETIRDFGGRRLLEEGEYPAVAKAHFGWVSDLAREGARGIEGRYQVEWLRRFRREIDNVRQALAWAVENEPVRGAKVVSSLSRFFFLYAAEGDSAVMSDSTSFLREGYNWSTAMLDAAGDGLPEGLRGRLQLAIGGLLCVRLGRYEEGLRRLEEATAIFERLGDERSLGWASFYRSVAGFGLVDLDETIRLVDSALRLHTSAGDRFGEAASMLVLGTFRSSRSPGSGRPQIEKFAVGADAIGSPFAIAHAADARAFDDALADRVTAESRQRVAKALSLFRRTNNYACLCHAMGTAAGVLARSSDFDGAAMTLGLTDTIRDRLSMAAAPYEQRDSYVLDICGDHAVEPEWERASTEGRTVEPAEGIDWVISRLGLEPAHFE